MKEEKKAHLVKAKEEKSYWLTTTIFIIGFLAIAAFGVFNINKSINTASQDYANAIESIPTPYEDSILNTNPNAISEPDYYSDTELLNRKIETILIAHPELITAENPILLEMLKDSSK